MTTDSDIASSQSAQVSGNYNIVVQASGDGITIDVARPHLTLDARHRFARTPKKYLDLLNPINRAIPLWFDAIMAGTNDVGALISIADQMPQHTLALSERAAGVYAAIAGIFSNATGSRGR